MANEQFNSLLDALILEADKLVTYHPNANFPRDYAKARLEAIKRLIEVWSTNEN